MSLEISRISNVEFEGIDYKDAPDFCDAYIVYAEYDGIEMTDEQYNELGNDSDLCYELLMKHIY